MAGKIVAELVAGKEIAQMNERERGVADDKRRRTQQDAVCDEERRRNTVDDANIANLRTGIRSNSCQRRNPTDDLNDKRYIHSFSLFDVFGFSREIVYNGTNGKSIYCSCFSCSTTC